MQRTLDYLPGSAMRGGVGLVSLMLIFTGATILWGFGGALLSLGLVMFVDISADELVERITGIRRGNYS